jgi:hypothetical protein
MGQLLAPAAVLPRYELRFENLFKGHCGFSFPCDVKGLVDIDSLSEKGRSNYYYARVVIGRELTMPIVTRVD